MNYHMAVKILVPISVLLGVFALLMPVQPEVTLTSRNWECTASKPQGLSTICTNYTRVFKHPKK